MLVFLGKFQSCLYLGSIVDDFSVKLATTFDQAFLLLVGLFQRAVKFFLLGTEPFQGLIPHKLLKNFLEVALQRLKSGGFKCHILTTSATFALFIVVRHAE